MVVIWLKKEAVKKIGKCLVINISTDTYHRDLNTNVIRQAKKPIGSSQKFSPRTEEYGLCGREKKKKNKIYIYIGGRYYRLKGCLKHSNTLFCLIVCRHFAPLL